MLADPGIRSASAGGMPQSNTSGETKQHKKRLSRSSVVPAKALSLAKLRMEESLIKGTANVVEAFGFLESMSQVPIEVADPGDDVSTLVHTLAGSDSGPRSTVHPRNRLGLHGASVGLW